MSAEVVLYTTNYCPYCTRAKRLLENKSVSYREVKVENEPSLRSWLVKASGQRTVPQVFINRRSIGGYDELSALERARKLDALLSEDLAGDAPSLPLGRVSA